MELKLVLGKNNTDQSQFCAHTAVGSQTDKYRYSLNNSFENFNEITNPQKRSF